MMTKEQEAFVAESLEYERRELEAFKDKFIGARPVSLTGNEAWKLYIKLQELEELREKNKELRQIIEKVRRATYSAVPWTNMR